MNIFKSKIGLKITVFATILLVCFWMIPSGMVFGEGEEGGGQGGTTVVETTAPETTAPETTAPETTAPETTAPETTAPETTAPETTAPETTAPETTAPETTVPETTAPETTASDITAPVITLLGDAEVNIFIGDSYSDAGATAEDDIDGDISANIVKDGNVDTSAAGSYDLTYNVSDAAGNNAAEVSRTVNVAEPPDNIPPIIDLIGNPVINLHIGNVFTDPGATATDNKDETVEVVASGTVDTNVEGSYVIRYNAADAAGNAAYTVTRTVNVTSEATINTNKPDYLPNDYVLVTGSGWLPGETVRLDFTETLLDPILQQTITYYTVADSEGNINDIQYLIELRHLGASFVLTATGQTSGSTAHANFTDGTVTITISKEVYESDGVTRATGDTTSFTIKVLKNIVSTIETRVLADGGSYTFTNNAGIAGALYSVTEDATPGYTTVLPSSQYKASGTINFVVKNIKAAPTTVTIKKEVYEADGTTIDADNADTFTIELWTANLLGGADTYKATAILTGNDTSDPIAVAPGVAYVVKETSTNPNYTVSYSPTSLLYPNDNSGTLTPAAGSSDKVFTVKNTQRGNTFTVTKTGLRHNDDYLSFYADKARFTLYNPSGIIVKTSTGADSIVLDCSDFLYSLNPDTYTWEKLSNGTGYLLVESYDISPANKFIYSSSLTNNQYFFNINGNNESVTVNNAACGSISAFKQDAVGIPLAGAEIGLYENQGDAQPIQTDISTDADVDPNVVFEDVASGGTNGKTYYIHEISSLPGYASDTGWYPITISESDLSPVLSSPIVNTPSGVIKLYKVDDKQNPLGGAVFGLYLSQDESAAPLTTATSQEGTGEVVFEHLSYKTYYIRETSAPFGFLLDENWYEVTLTPNNTPYAIEAPIVDLPGGTITVTKNVIAPDGKTDVADAKEFTITLEKNDGSGNWVTVKSTTIKEGSPVIFAVPLNVSYRVTETADSKYTETSNNGEVTLTVAGQNQDLLITNRQHYAVVIIGKIIYQWNTLLPSLITDDDHIFFTKLDGDFTPLIDWHPLSTKLPTVFLVWPGTYTVFEKPDVNYNDYGQPLVLSGFDISDLNLADLGDISNIITILLGNLLGGGGSSEITLEGGDISPLIIANKYTPQFGTVTVTKDVVGPVGGEATDGKEFSVKLQRLDLTLPNILDMLNLSNLGNIANLSDLMDILDVSQLGSLSDLLGWEDVGTLQTISEGNPVTFTGVEKDHIYRVVETQEPGYLQIKGILPFYFAPEDTDKPIEVVNKQELVWVKVHKEVLGADGLPVEDSNWFLVSLDGGTTPTFPHMIKEEVETLFGVMPGTYTLNECSLQSGYERVDTNKTITLNPGDGPLCTPIELTVINKQKPGTINITKWGLMPGDSAIFTLCDKNGNPIAGKDPITLTQGQSLSGSWTGLNWGSYSIKESYPTANLYTYGKTLYSPSCPITIGFTGCFIADLTKCVNITNCDPQIKTAKIVVIKNIIGTAPSEGFSFTNSQDPSGFTLNGSESPTPWMQGIIVEAGKTYTIAENDPGIDWETEWSSTIPGAATGTSRDVTFAVTGSNVESIDGQTITFDNTRKTCEVTINKTIDNAPAADGSFGYSGGLGGFSLPDAGSYSKSFTVECGIEYTVSEDSMSAGYAFDNISTSGEVTVVSQSGSSITFKISCTGDGSIESRISQDSIIETEEPNEITFNNSRLPGSITLHKTDAVSGANLQGSTFTLYLLEDFPDVSVQTEVSAQTTDENGAAVFSNLAWGTYLVKETQPPEGYLPMETTVTIDGDHLAVSLESEIADPRIPGRIKITKVDEAGVPIAGIGFTLFNSDKTEVIRSEKETDAAGKLLFDNLDWGTYILSETNSLDYTAADDIKIKISVKNAADGEKVTVTNDTPGSSTSIVVAGITEGIQVLAFTGIDPIIPLSGGSAVIAGIAMLVASLRRKYRNRKQ